MTATEALEVVRELCAKAIAAEDCAHCPPPTTIECPRGCGVVAMARPHLVWGPWRMQVHLMSPRCPTPMPGTVPTRRRR